MTTLLDQFALIIKALNDQNIEYAVCGGWAMTIQGAPRATVDIDLLILSESLAAVLRTAKDLGYWLDGVPMSFHNGAVEIRRVSKIEAETGNVFTLDLLLVTPASREVWQEREHVEWQNGKISVVSRAGLIKLKTISGRKQDLADIERLEELENES